MPRRISAVLFDLDGVLVESREATERAWLHWASENGIEEAALRSAMHGVRSADVIRALAPALDADAESERVERRQAEDTAGLRALPGAAAALEAFRPDRIAIVTSGTRPLALGRLQVVGIEAGRAAGMATVGVVTTHARAELAAADAVIGSI